MHATAGKTWGKTKGRASVSAKPSGSVQQKIRRILGHHPEGLRVKDLITKLKGAGYSPSGDASGYISQACSTDPEITRVERGIYCLKNPPTPKVAKTPETTQEVVHSRDALLVRIEHLEAERNALRVLVAANTHAQLAFVREVGA